MIRSDDKFALRLFACVSGSLLAIVGLVCIIVGVLRDRFLLDSARVQASSCHDQMTVSSNTVGCRPDQDMETYFAGGSTVLVKCICKKGTK